MAKLDHVASVVLDNLWNTEKHVALQPLVLLEVVLLHDLDHQEVVDHVQVAPPAVHPRPPLLEGEAEA